MKVKKETSSRHIFCFALSNPLIKKQAIPEGMSCFLVGEDGFGEPRAGNVPQALFLIRPFESIHKKLRYIKRCISIWWGKMDSNHRRRSQQIYSLSPLATREFPHIELCLLCAS